MKIPALQGSPPKENRIVYTSADDVYFNLYAKPLINSVKQHLEFPIFVHLYNPSDDTREWCEKNSVNYSYELFDESILIETYNRWKVDQLSEDDQRKKSHMVKDPTDLDRLKNEIKRTYFACTRFIRLAELLSKPTYVIMLDTDSIVRKNFVLPNDAVDIHIFEKKHKKHVPYTQHLASTIFYTGTDNSFKLINDHAELIRQEYERDALYWFLDQDTLDVAIQSCRKRPLDKSLVDFEMNQNSPIWCAKGPRKFQPVYLNEIKKYL
jgi:hypothetical protein